MQLCCCCLCFFLLIAVITVPFSSQAVECVLETQLVGPHQALLLQNASSSPCDLGPRESAIGTLAESSGDLGVGVVSAVVSSSLGNHNGWIITLFTVLDQDFNPSLQEWKFHNASCWFELQEGLAVDSLFPTVLDVGDTLILQVVAQPATNLSTTIMAAIANEDSPIADLSDEDILSFIPLHFGDITVLFENNASLFVFTPIMTQNVYMQTVSLKLLQRPTIPMDHSQVTFRLQTCPQLCSLCNTSVVIRSGCPEGRGLVFSYPKLRNETNLRELSVNYRPPSSSGVHISTSPHVYNADPALPFSTTQLIVSTAAVYKQCFGKLSRADCGCLPEQATSTDISETDCIQMVYRHLFADTLPLTFSMGLLDNSMDDELSSLPVLVEELNNRTDYQVVMEAPKGIIFNGGELYHFRASFTTLTSFCSLTTEFVVYVEKEPLKKVEEQVISSVTAVSCGLMLLLAYILHSYFTNNPTVLLRRIHALKHPHL